MHGYTTYLIPCNNAQQVSKSGTQLFRDKRSANGSSTVPAPIKNSLTAAVTTNNYTSLSRVIFGFDTSSISSLENIISAVFSVQILNNSNNLLLSDSQAGIGLVESLVKDLNASAAKYNLSNLDLTLLANKLNNSDCVMGSIQNFNLNTLGINKIQKGVGGISTFALLFNIDIYANNPNWVSGATTQVGYDQTYNNGALLTIMTGTVKIPSIPDIHFIDG